MSAVSRLDTFSRADHQALTGLLHDAVKHGASVGFVMPVADAAIAAYWQAVEASVMAKTVIQLVARVHESGVARIVGAVQLAYATKSNATHRAEIQKMLVHSAYQRQGFGRQLMLAAEAVAVADGKSLLVLDTETDSAGHCLYASLGYVVAGTIPKYAIGTHGGWSPSTFMYKLL